MIKEIEVGGVKHGITLADDMVGKGLVKDENGVVSVDVENLEINEEKLVKTTWAELKALRDESKLVAGTFYRITDYVTTTTQSETKSANHPFDVIVLALSENTLCEDAKAILHEGDTYFADSDLSAWELKYCLDNDKTRFEWADETNGKGVIYRMVDEKRNDCPYDFKNILFYNTKFTYSTTSDKYYYTFSFVVSDVLYDGTTEKRAKHCYGNMMGGYYQSGALRLNKNVFRNSSFSYSLNFNILRENCYSNTFGGSCFNNTFGIDCSFNNFGEVCYLNTFGNNCIHNELGDNCFSNTFKNNCQSNTFGDYCSFNTLESRVQNRSLDLYTTTLTLRINEEFYDDGSGQLVPIKHPDLSTQPSILPYKFMGQYVYEQLIPRSDFAYIGSSCDLKKGVIPNNSIILSAWIILKGGVKPVAALISDESGITLDATSIMGQMFSESDFLFAKIIYTSMPEENSYYYGYNNYGGNIEEDFSNAAVIRLEGDYWSIQSVNFLGEDIERINYNTYVYRNLSSASNTTGTSITITDNTGNFKKPKSVKIYLDGVELDSTKVEIQNYGVTDISTPLEINKYNTIEAIINL